ncbi:MAG: alpha-galactosidase [Armatimonadetes bacterium]|nr:alpha-galactosidase [Armatimonadota bacterium]
MTICASIRPVRGFIWSWSLVCLFAASTVMAQTAVLEYKATGVKFILDASHGNIASAFLGREQLLSSCYDEYWSQADDQSFPNKSSEAEDRVVSTKSWAGAVEFVCKNEALGLSLTKTYALGPVPGSLRKTVAVQPFRERRVLHVLSRVRLAPQFASKAWLYTPRQSWGGRLLLYGVRKLAEIHQPITSTSGWDNRFVVGFRPDSKAAISHWLAQTNGVWVPCSMVVSEWGKEPAVALTYFPDGWRFRLLMASEGHETSAACDYVLHDGDWYDGWRLYRSLPELRAAYSHLEATPEWCRKVKYGSFWHPPDYNAEAIKRLCDRLGPDAYLTLGVFGWSLDGDYETDRPFLMETLALVLTPEHLAKAIADLQSDPRAKVGLYIQGGLIDSESQLYRDHPDWVIRDAEGRPIDSGFADNPVGHMYMANPRCEAWVQHHLSRVQAVCRRYNCGYIYLDGGGYGEAVDWTSRQVASAADCRRLNERFFRAVRATGADRGLLINSQNMPFADMSWLECPYFDRSYSWRDTVEFCFDTECMSDPRYTLEPLYWSDNDRYLAMCIAFGFTPCGDAHYEKPEATWRAIEAAYKMKAGRLIYDSRATAPVWWRDGVPVVTFAERVGREIVVPVLNFGESEQVAVVVDLRAVGLDKAGNVRATAYQPLISAELKEIRGRRAGSDRLCFDLHVPVSWRGITLLTLSSP